MAHGRETEYAGRRVVVAGARVAGAACARVLMGLGAQVTVVDRTPSANTEELAAAGARVVIADQPTADLFDGVSDLVVSPGFAPHHPLVAAASSNSITGTMVHRQFTAWPGKPLSPVRGSITGGLSNAKIIPSIS